MSTLLKASVLNPYQLRLGCLVLAVTTVLSLTGCAGGGSGSGASPSSPTVGSKTFLGTSRSYNSGLVQAVSAEQEFKNLSQYGEVLLFAGAPPFSSVHPLELTNVHKAYGYGLTGQGKGIAIFDTGFNTNQEFLSGTAFAEMQSKYKAGEIKIHGNLEDNGSSHGNQVASIAAAKRDGQGYDYYLNQTGQRYPAFVNNAYDLLNHGMTGVAPNARLHLFDVNNFNTFPLMVLAVEAAKAEKTVVQNNSWGLTTEVTTGRPFNRSTVLALPPSLPSSLGNKDLESASNWLASYTGFSKGSWSDYLKALKDYQSTGVVVFALQNDASSAQPSLMAALPEVYPDLKPAWLAVGNIDTLGTASSLSIRREAAPCGAAASYCLVADGTEVTGAGLDNAGGTASGYSYGQTGTSFSAPQVSGMVALLAEAFPNLSPEDLVTRLLATANNSFFTPTAERVFSQEIRHGYNEEFGHGIPDLYAALQPITTGSRPLGFVLNGTPASGSVQALSKSSLLTGASLSKALAQGFDKSTAYSYDALGAGFKVALSNLIKSPVTAGAVENWLATRSKDAAQILNVQGAFFADSGPLTFASGSSLSALHSYSETGPSHWGTAFPSSYGLTFSPMDFATAIPLRTGRLIGYMGKSQQADLGSSVTNPNVFGTAYSLSFNSNGGSKTTLMVGAQREAESLRGAAGEGALAIARHSASFFVAPSYQFLFDQWSFSAGASLGLSKAQPALGSMIQSVSALVSSEFFAVMARHDVFKSGDKGYLKVWQPETVESGRLQLQLPNLVGPSREVSFTEQTVELSAQSRPWHLGFGYETRLRPGLHLQNEIMVIPSQASSHDTGHSLGIAVRLQQVF